MLLAEVLPSRWFILILSLVLLLLAACSTGRYSSRYDSAPRVGRNVENIPDAIPKKEPRSKYGNKSSYVVRGRRYHVMKSSDGYSERGIASWYGTKFHGHRTSSGDTYDMYAMSAAHRSLPLPTYVEVSNLENDKRVVVRVNDRGPFHSNRLIDLSYAAAKKLGITEEGTGLVEVRAIDPEFPKQVDTQTTNRVVHHGNYRLFLQVGAFISRVNAERLKNQLSMLARPHRVKTDYSDKDRLYRVKIGPVPSVEIADRLAERIGEIGIHSPHVIIN